MIANKIKKLLFGLLLLPAVVWGQSHTISGTITDKGTGETLIGATVMDLRSGKGTVTNAYGYYSLTLPGDTIHLRVSYIGYRMVLDTFVLKQNERHNYAIVGSTELNEVVIVADRVADHRSSQISAIEVPVEHLKAVPVLFGESDILKALQLLPGVQSGSEGMSGMYVRGGGPDENLFLLDGVPLYNVNHLGGFFSAFNSDAVKNVTLYKGSFPAHFGGRISSVLDITTNDGNDKKLHGLASIGAISARVNLEGPIVKEKTTFSLSTRRTYADALIQPFVALLGIEEGLKTRGGYYFYDLNAKVTHRFSDRSRLYASYYMGDDVLYAKVKTRDDETTYYYDSGIGEEYMKFRTSWGNLVGSLRWNYEITPRLMMNLSGSFTRYRSSISLGYEGSYSSPTYTSESSVEMDYNSGIRDAAVRADFDYQPNPNHKVKFGTAYTHHLFTPEVVSVSYLDRYNIDDYRDDNYADQLDTTIGESRIHANELCAYIEDDWSISDAWKVNCGVMLSGFSVQDAFYPSVQPRVSGRLLLTDDLSLKVGYSYMTQYMHLLSNTSVSLPFDLWVPVTARITPMNAHQVAAGVFYNWRGLVDLSAEGYYKRMDNLMEYKDGASFFGSSTGWEDKVCLGEGWAYGLELLAQKSVGKLNGWIGYTWSHTERLFDRKGMELNHGNPFPAKYDRRHDLSIVLMYKPSKEFDCGITWVYSTGTAATLALQNFEGRVDGYYFDENDKPIPSYQSVDYVEARNNYRMPNYHRMDVSVNFHKEKRHGIRTWNISIYNVYNRQNPYMIYRSYNHHYVFEGRSYNSALVQLSLFPIIPTVTYIFKF